MNGPLSWFKIGIGRFVREATTPFPGGCSFRVLFQGDRQFVWFGCYSGPFAYAGDAKKAVFEAIQRNDGDPLRFDAPPAELIELALPSRTCRRCFAPFHLEAA